MTVPSPLKVFFDASCALCNNEMQIIRLHDTKQQLLLIDCSAGDFEDTPYLAEGVSQAAMMECLHVRNGRGEWIKGVMDQGCRCL